MCKWSVKKNFHKMNVPLRDLKGKTEINLQNEAIDNFNRYTIDANVIK